MALEAQYIFDGAGNVADTSGNGRHGSIVGAGPSYVTVNAIPIVGSRNVKAFSSANFISLPVSALSNMATAGEIRWFAFVGESESVTGQVFLSAMCGSSARRFLPFMASGTGFTMFIPTAGSMDIQNGSVGYAKKGRWVCYRVIWAPGAWSFVRVDMVTRVAQTICSGTLNVSFAGVTELQLGVGASSDSYNWPLAVNLSCVQFYSGTAPSIEGGLPTQFKQPKEFALFGNSIAEGNYGVFAADPPTTDGWRKGFRDRAAVLGRPWFHTGTSVKGTIEAPYHDAHTGDHSGQTSAIVTARIASIFPNPTADSNVFLGASLFCNDPYFSVSTATSRSNLDTIINTINTRSALIKIFLVMDVSSNPGSGDTVLPYRQVMQDAYTAAKAAGKNVYLIDPGYGAPYPSRVPAHLLCDDLLHPRGAGEISIGTYIANAVEAALYPPAPSSGGGAWVPGYRRRRAR